MKKKKLWKGKNFGLSLEWKPESFNNINYQNSFESNMSFNSKKEIVENNAETRPWPKPCSNPSVEGSH